MADWRNELGGQLLPPLTTASGWVGDAVDVRMSNWWAMVEAKTPAASALISLQASMDGTTTGNWYPVAQYTAIPAGVTAQLSGAYYPFVRAVVNAIWSGGGNTGYPSLSYAPGYL